MQLTIGYTKPTFQIYIYMFVKFCFRDPLVSQHVDNIFKTHTIREVILQNVPK